MIHWLTLWGAGVGFGLAVMLIFDRYNDLRSDQVLTVWYGLNWILAFYAIGFCLLGWYSFPATTLSLWAFSRFLDWRAKKELGK